LRLAWPPEYSASRLDPGRCYPGSSSYGVGYSFRVPGLLKYRSYWLNVPALPLEVPSAVRSSLNRLRWSQPCVQSSPLFEFRSPLESTLANPSRPAAARQLLSWAPVPFSTRGLGDPLAAGFPGPATFRLQGLATLLTAYSLRAPAGFVSHRQRSWDSPFGAFPSRKVSGALPPGSTHIPFPLSAHPPPGRPTPPKGRGSWALTLPRVPRGRHGFSTPTAGCSLGLRPF
jgi:hypothetical protein